MSSNMDVTHDLVVIGAGASFFSSASNTATQSGTLAPPHNTNAQKVAAADAPAKGDPECEKRWLAAEKAGITLGEGMVDGRLTVMVDEATYNAVDYATKVGMAATLQCATVGHDHALAAVYFVSNMTGKTLAIWKLNRLEVQ